MLAIVSPAKKLDMNPLERSLSLSQPSLMGDTERVVEGAKRLKPDDLRSLMGGSESLATLNRRFQSFTTPPPIHSENAKPAALMFNGDTYTGLEARLSLRGRPGLGAGHLASSRVSTASFAPWTSSSPTDSRWAPS